MPVLTITITNSPSNGDFLTVNGNTRTWTNVVISPATQILISTNGIGGNATNLFRAIGASPYAGPLTPQRIGTNAVRLLGLPSQTISYSASTGWATLTTSTNSNAPGFAVRVPMTTQEPVDTQRTNIASLLIADLSTFPTNSFPELAKALENFVALVKAQIVGNKTLTNSSWEFTTNSFPSQTTRTLIIGANSGFPVLVDTNTDAAYFDASPAALDKMVLNGALARRLFNLIEITNIPPIYTGSSAEVLVADSVDLLELFPEPTHESVAFTWGQAAPGDGNGRRYIWNFTSTATADRMSVVIPDGKDPATLGRWEEY